MAGAWREGWLSGAFERRSPHFDARPEGTSVDLLVLHYISLPPGVFGTGDPERLFLGTLDADARPEYAPLRGLRVSSHFLIERTGRVSQFVSVHDRAWHAGLSNFRGRNACNDFSVGVELEGCGDRPFEDAQYAALEALVQDLRRELPLRFVTGHEHIAPERKADPGPFFDWERVRRFLPEGMETAIRPEDCCREMLTERMRSLAAGRG